MFEGKDKDSSPWKETEDELLQHAVSTRQTLFVAQTSGTRKRAKRNRSASDEEVVRDIFELFGEEIDTDTGDDEEQDPKEDEEGMEELKNEENDAEEEGSEQDGEDQGHHNCDSLLLTKVFGKTARDAPYCRGD